MANMATYKMVVKGSNENVRKFVAKARKETGLFYGENYHPVRYEEGKATLLNGAWKSVWASTAIDTSCYDIDYNNSWIVKMSKELNLTIGYRSYEPGYGFTENFEVINGEVVTDESADMMIDEENEELFSKWIKKVR